MARDRKTAAGAVLGWAAHDISYRPVRLNEVKVGRGDIRQPVAQVAHEGHAFQKHFGQHDCRAHIEINATAIHSSYQLREQAEVCVRCCSECGTVEGRMEVCDVAADGDVCGKGNSSFVGGAE